MMEELGIGLADLLVMTFLVGLAQGLAGVIIEAYRRHDDTHPLDEALRVLALNAQEELPRIREALELMSIDDDEEPKRGKK